VGEEAFFDFLKDYYASGRGRFVTASDFFTALGRHTDKDITPLLKEFFRRPPNLAPGGAEK
jgi:aminopeptidase N